MDVSECERRARLGYLETLLVTVRAFPVAKRELALRVELRECQPLFPDDTKPTVLREVLARVEAGRPPLAALIFLANRARHALDEVAP